MLTLQRRTKGAIMNLNNLGQMREALVIHAQDLFRERLLSKAAFHRVVRQYRECSPREVVRLHNTVIREELV